MTLPVEINPLLLGSQDTGYKIERSLRFNPADNAYLRRTPASASNKRTWTWSAWVKRCNPNNTGMLFESRPPIADNDRTFIILHATTTVNLEVTDISGGAHAWDLRTTQVFRDPSAWYHIVVAYDSTQATSSDRVKIYGNGVRVTSFITATYPSLNYESDINDALPHTIGDSATAYSANFDGYMADVHFIDGQALDPSSFGEFDTITGVWKPKAYTGSYGTNGFRLDFADNSTTTALGYDAAGSNNWTPNNFSVTAGAGNDSLVDTPTAYGTDTGAGGEVRGNYATLNPLDTGASGSTISDGNLKVVTASAGYRYMGNTIWPSSGKFYAEFKLTATTGYAQVGIATATTNSDKILGQDSTSWSYDSWSGQYRNNNTGNTFGSTWTTNDVIGICLDKDNNKLYFSKNGTWQNSADPAAGTGSISISSIAGLPTLIGICDNDNGGSVTFEANFGARPFAYAAPAGFKALVTTNLPEPTIVDGGAYFKPVLYTGNASSQSITGVGFRPDWIWIKSRSNGALNHALFDVLRGTPRLDTSTTVAEGEFNQLNTYDSNGFTLKNETTVNQSGGSYVAWNWKAGGSGVSNTAGSISSTVSANASAGFSIVTYTGNGTAGATVGHGLGVAPSMMIVKWRDGADDWCVYNKNLSTSRSLWLNSTSAQLSSSYFGFFWNNTDPTSSVFTLGSNGAVNGSSRTYVAYCFAPIAGYSAFGSYTGNGSTDGPFVFTGFRPRWIMFKKSSAADDWIIYDSERDTYNVASKNLYANGSYAEDTNTTNRAADILSNGFKLRSGATYMNASGATFIYAAFAENPFKYSLAR